MKVSTLELYYNEKDIITWWKILITIKTCHRIPLD